MSTLAIAIPRPLDRLLAEERDKAAEVAAGLYGASPTGATTPGGSRPGGAPPTDALRKMKKMPLSSSVAAVVEVPPGR
jgi:hypothetical protein